MKAALPLLDSLRRFLSALPLREGVVVAVSGGPDSVALLRGLVALNVAPLTVAHLNHQLRGAESDADEEFVKSVVEMLRSTEAQALELRCRRIDVATEVQRTADNLENTARRLRYDWLAGVAREVGACWIATGHTADDQAETVLHRLLRGTGLHGLRGIAPRRRLAPDVELIRPLLAVSRAEVLAYLEALGQPFRQDGSNADQRWTRNRIRHELLPYLVKHYNPAVTRLLARLAEQAEQVCHEDDERIRQLLTEVERSRAGGLLVLDRSRLIRESRQRIRSVFRLLWEREGWPSGAMTFDAWDRLAAVVLGEMTAVDLPHGLRAWGRERVIQVGPVD